MNRDHLRLNYREMNVSNPGDGFCPRNSGLRALRRGFSLIELLVAMAVGMVVLSAMYGVFNIQSKTLSNQEETVVMQQSVRAGMDMMAREIGMAGYDPARVNCSSCTTPAYIFFGATVNASQLQIKADLNGDGAIDASNQENIIYAFDATNKQITRSINGVAQSFVGNVDDFTFKYLDSGGIATVTAANVRQIEIKIKGRTAKPDPSYSANGGYRNYTLTSVIAPRNLAF